MNLLDLPLELVRAVLAEAMLARGLTRALRLRLVSKFFSSEILKTLPALKMLDTCDTRVDHIGKTGIIYLSQRLLSKDTTLSPRLHNIRRIASRLAQDDSGFGVRNSESHTNYIDKLSFLLINSSNLSFKSLFGPDQYAVNNTELHDYDFLSAAAFTGHLYLVEELCLKVDLGKVTIGTLGNPYKAAALGGHVQIIKNLLNKGYTQRVASMLCSASKAGNLPTVKYLLASWKPNLWYPKNARQKGEVYAKFHEAMSAPSMEIFASLLQFKETSRSPDKGLSQEELTDILWTCCLDGNPEVAEHLINLGASIYGDQGTQFLQDCKQADMMRLLLQRGVKTAGDGSEMVKAAGKGRLDLVRLLVEYGESVHCGSPRPVVCAIELEHIAMFQFLVEHGALDEEDAGKVAMERAKELGLETMVALLEEHGGSISIQQ